MSFFGRLWPHCFPALIFSLMLAGCGGSNLKTEYVLAETLWQQGSYEAAVRQFERVYQKDPKGKLGQQSLFRSAMTHYLFLRKFPEAIELFNKYLEIVPEGPTAAEARLTIGEIYFSKMAQYEKAIDHYRKLLKRDPNGGDLAEFLFRIARSQFFLWQFEESIKTFEKVIAVAPASAQAASAAYQIGVAHLSLAAQPKSTASHEGAEDEADTESPLDSRAHYRLAIQAFENTETKYPRTRAAQEAALGVVSALEEQGLWEEALNRLKSIDQKYPVPQVVQIRSHRIQERLAKRRLAPRAQH
ncbi:MAG: tetratricopeptide repeat protein [Bdellovibrionales bacterium]|nr:tetratricopeptide repeat protein [Bdellovibrionales bacterium]